MAAARDPRPASPGPPTRRANPSFPSMLNHAARRGELRQGLLPPDRRSSRGRATSAGVKRRLYRGWMAAGPRPAPGARLRSGGEAAVDDRGRRGRGRRQGLRPARGPQHRPRRRPTRSRGRAAPSPYRPPPDRPPRPDSCTYGASRERRGPGSTDLPRPDGDLFRSREEVVDQAVAPQSGRAGHAEESSASEGSRTLHEDVHHRIHQEIRPPVLRSASRRRARGASST